MLQEADLIQGDRAGRTITYRYDCDSNLMSVTGPVVEGFPKGKTTRYVYSGGFPEFTPEGDPAPNFTLLDQDGKPITLASYQGDRVVVQRAGARGDLFGSVRMTVEARFGHEQA